MSAPDLHPRAPRRSLIIVTVAVAAILAACSSSSATPSASEAPSAAASQAALASTAATAVPTPTPSTNATETELPTDVPTAYDPCVLVPSDEASTLTGATYGAGVESTAGNTKFCTYGSNTLNVLTVAVGVAADEATAQAGEAQFVTQLQAAAANGLTVTQLTGFTADSDAAVLSGSMTVSGQTFSASAITVLRGTVFFGFSDVTLGTPAPSSADLQSEAMTVLGRL